MSTRRLTAVVECVPAYSYHPLYATTGNPEKFRDARHYIWVCRLACGHRVFRNRRTDGTDKPPARLSCECCTEEART